MRVDLHIHSTASDGCWHPPQLVSQVRQEGIDLFAVADHDTVANVRPVERLARDSGLAFIPAVEVSTTMDGHLFHVLGYGIDPEDPSLFRVLRRNEETLESLNQQSIHRLIEAGYDIRWEEYDVYEDDVTRGGWKALNLLIDKGFCHDVSDYFDRLFVGDMALQMPSFAAPEEAVRAIHRAGGVAVCAHPGNRIRPGETALLEHLLACGIDGLECYTPYHDEETTQGLLRFCRRHNLLVTAGSDCHGGFARRALGRPRAHVRDLRLGPLLKQVLR